MLLANYQLIVVFLLEVWFILLFSEHNKILPCTTKSFIELIGQYIFTIAKNLWHCSCVLINVSPWLVAKVSLIFRDTFLHGTEGVRREYGTMNNRNSQIYLITNIWQNKLVFLLLVWWLLNNTKLFFLFFWLSTKGDDSKEVSNATTYHGILVFRKQKSLNKWTAFSGKNEV